MKLSKPKISTIVITYNQEKYIEKALQSIVDQNVDFHVEIIVADDGSNDNTPNIIRRFAKKYPEIIQPILRNKNIGAWNNFVDAIRNSSGSYIALCEGDDYWTDNNKLQKQSEFLDSNLTYSMVFHPVRVIYENSKFKSYTYPDHTNEKKFTLQELIKENYIQTNSVMYRRQDYRSLASEIMPGDWYLHLFHAKNGKIGYINEIMSVYRKHDEGLWWNSQSNPDLVWKKHGIDMLGLFAEMLKMFGNSKEIVSVINNSIITSFETLSRIDFNYNTNLLARANTRFPFEAVIYMNNLKEQITIIDEHSKKQAIIIEHLNRKNTDLSQKLKSVTVIAELYNKQPHVRLKRKVKNIIRVTRKNIEEVN